MAENNTFEHPALLESARLALRVSTHAFDAEIQLLILAAIGDLQVAGVVIEGNSADTDPLLIRAIVTYCKVNFGEPDEYVRLKRSYDEQKAQLVTATGYTNWEVTGNGQE